MTNSIKTSVSYLLNTPSAHEIFPIPSGPYTAEEEPSSASKSTRSRRFPCATCGFVFFTNSDLQKHISSVHLQLRPYGCTMCDRRFGEKSNANKHFRSVHAKARPEECRQCGATFAFRDGLARHVRLVHQGVRSFHCSVPNCKSAPFKQAAHLKKHMQSVHKLPVSPVAVRKGHSRTLRTSGNSLNNERISCP